MPPRIAGKSIWQYPLSNIELAGSRAEQISMQTHLDTVSQLDGRIGDLLTTSSLALWFADCEEGKARQKFTFCKILFLFLFCSMQAQQSLNYLLAIAVGSQLGFQLLAMLPQCCRLTVPGRWQCRRLCGSLGCHKSSKKT